MAGNKYLKIGTTGLATEQAALQESAGAGDAGAIVALDSAGKLDPSMLPAGIGINVDLIAATENLSAGDFVNIYNDTVSAKVRKADASNGRAAHGFVKAAVTSGNNATVYGSGELNDNLADLEPGEAYYLSTSAAGGVQLGVASGSGHLVQLLGVAKSATALRFNFNNPLVRA